MQPLWTLRGTGVLLMRDVRRALALMHYDSSPVGTYDELAVIELSLRGPSVTEISVTSPASRDAGRALWGFPKSLENLSWNRNEKHIVFQSECTTFRFRNAKFSFPIQVKAWTNQTLNGQKVRVPCRVSGRARIAFRGKQWALFLEDFELQVFAPIAEYQPSNTKR